MKKFVKGMHKDSERVDQPEGTYRDALNANLYYSKGAIVNEEGTTELGGLPINVIGSIPLLNDQIVVFGWVDYSGGATPSFTGGSDLSSIVLYDTKKNSSRVLYTDPELNFQKTHPITGEFKVDNKNETIVYFTDNYYLEENTPEGTALSEYNSPRAFNITRQLDHLDAGGDKEVLYDSLENFSVSKLDLFAAVGKHSLIEKVDINEGGVLVTGAYYLALCYSDENFLETDYFVVSNPVYIVPGLEQNYPADGLIGAQAGTQTNKSIEFYVRVFRNNNYKFLQPAIIQRVGNAEFAYKLERIEIDPKSDSEQIKISYTGNEDASTTSVEDIVIDNVRYLTAKGITQLDDRLYLANLRSRKDIGFQRYASNIVIEAVTTPFNNFDIRVYDVQSLNKGYAMMLLPYANQSNVQGSQFGIGQTYLQKESGSGTGISFVEDQIRRSYFEHIQTFLNYGDGVTVGNVLNLDTHTLTDKVAKGYKDYRFNFKHKSFRRGEVYAFYISFVLNDGTETYAYHIPGRDARKTPGQRGVTERDNFSDSPGKWDEIKTAVGFYPAEIASFDSTARIYQYVDTSTVSFSDGQTYNMGFWENINEVYPLTRDFVGAAVDSEGNSSVDDSLTLAGLNVRHHKMPSNHNQDFSYIQMKNGDSYYSSNQGIISDNFGDPTLLENAGFNHPYTNDANITRKLVSKDPVRLLGIQLKNLKIPRHILKKVQGYKIYYAKRKEEDKLIAGQSLAVPSHPRYASVPTQNKLLARKGPFKNAFYLYGGLEHTDANAMEIRAEWKKAWQTDDRYIGHPVFTFHDFNMLRKRPTLEGLTHVSCQSAVAFRTYSGGPGVFANPATYEELITDEDGTSTGYTQFGLGGAEKLTTFPSLGWIHPDLGNTTDFDQDGLVIDITDNFIDLTEDVANPYGYGDGGNPPDRKRKKGKQKDDADAQNKVRDDALRIKQWRTSVNLAASYIKPGAITGVIEVVKGGSTRGTGWNRHWDNGQFLPANQWIFRIDPRSRIYAQGQANIEVPESTSFSGAQLLYNRAGESSIAIGLTSGLPHLKGLRLYSSQYLSAGPENGTAWDIVKWGDATNFLFPDSFYWSKLPDHFEDNTNFADLEEARKAYRGYNYYLDGLQNQYDGYPMAWLVNLESAKTDVHSPFDKQELVWTGYYHPINPKKALDQDGNEVINYESGEAEDDYGQSQNYYLGASSRKIFGGDTYITRYSFRATSHSYGHCFFRGAPNLGDPGSEDVDGNENNTFHVKDGNRDRFQADLPDIHNPLRSAQWGKTGPMSIWVDSGELGPADEKIFAASKLINQTNNWVQGDSDPVSTLFSFMVESDDNIGFRHKVDVEKGVTTKFFDGDIAAEVLFAPPTEDLTKQDNLLYEDHYSALQNVKVAVPYPKRTPADDDITKFGSRVIRSNNAEGTIGDKYRQFLANEYKDLPRNRGDIWTLFTMSGLLMINTERSLFKTQGKENLAVGDITAFIGSGDIFVQDPQEVRETENGYGGTTSVLGGVSTPYGRFYVSRRDRAIYNFVGEIQEVSTGMDAWFRENMPFNIEQYGIDVEADDFPYDPDATTAPAAMGFTVGYDPKYKRVLVTKRERVPTQKTIISINKYNASEPVGSIFVENNKFYEVVGAGTYQELNLANPVYFAAGGWTLSYYPELQVWGSRHSYLPRIYSSTAESMFSFFGTKLWEHNNVAEPGKFYGTTYPFEFEYIDNTSPGESKSFASVAFFADVFKKDETHRSELTTRTSSGFTSFYVYNTTQVSALETNINYLNNARRVDKIWYINSFRDLAKYTDQTSDFINSGQPTVVDSFVTTVNAPTSSEPMFTEEGKVNPDYIDSAKPWFLQKKFVDHYMGVRLISDNTSTDLVYLYAAGTKFRKSYR